MDSFPFHLPPIYYIYYRGITPVDSTRVNVQYCTCTHTNAILKAQWPAGGRRFPSRDPARAVRCKGYRAGTGRASAGFLQGLSGGGPRVVVSTAAFHARVRGSVPGLGGLKGTKLFLPHPRVKVSIVGSLRDREVACSASDRQGSNFESCVWRTVSSQSSHHPQEVLLAQFSLYVHKGGLKPDSFHFVGPLIGPGKGI